MATAPISGESQALLHDDFNGSAVSTSLWHFPLWQPINNPTYYGRTQIRQALPQVADGVLRLQLDTYNPTGFSLFGSELVSNEYFARGAGIAFEARARLAAPAQCGMVGGIFAYEYQSASAHDEITFELLGNDAVADRSRVLTNAYDEQPFGVGDPGYVAVGSEVTAYHTYRIELMPSSVRWFVDGRLVRLETDTVPDDPMQLHLNFWGPGQEWPDAYCSELQPVRTAGVNRAFLFEVDYAHVARLATPNEPTPSDDLLVGGTGNDTLDGSTGADMMVGGAGDDIYVVENPGDTVIEDPGAGNDTIRASISYALPANAETLVLIGTTDIDGTGNGGPNRITGNGGNNILRGAGGDDTIAGEAGVDTAVQAAAFRQYALAADTNGTVTLSGPEGSDTLTSIETLAFVDGRLTFDPGDHMAQAYRLYFATLDRAPDPLGLNFQSARLDAGTAITDVAAGFVASPEFQATYGQLSDEAFVELLYQNVLDRSAAADEIAYHVGRMQSGASRSDIVVGFSESPEHIQKHGAAVNAGLWDIDEGLASVSRLYFGMLERTPETAGLVYYEDALAKGLTVQQVANNFSLSPEFQAKYGQLSDAAYVTQLYANVLERSASPDGVAYHVGRLSAGGSRGDVAAGFTEAPEYQAKMLGFVDQGIAVSDAGFVLP